MLDMIEKYIVLIKENRELKRLIDEYKNNDDVSNSFDMDYILSKRMKKTYLNNVQLLSNYEYAYSRNLNNLSCDEIANLINKLVVNLKGCLKKLDKLIEEENDIKVVTEVLELNNNLVDNYYSVNRRIFSDYIYCYTYFINDLKGVLKSKGFRKMKRI